MYAALSYVVGAGDAAYTCTPCIPCIPCTPGIPCIPPPCGPDARGVGAGDAAAAAWFPIQALFRLYECSIKALLRLYEGSIKAQL